MNLRTFLDNLPRGGLDTFAERVGKSTVYLHQIAAGQGGRKPSAQLAVVIERESNYQVRRWDLRPTDWHLIWPELVKAPGHPEVPRGPEPTVASLQGAT